MGNVTGTSGEVFPPAGPCQFKTLGIDGVGLIGGSIAAAAKARTVCRHVIGFGRSAARLEAAKKAGLIDDYALDGSAAAQVDLYVCCLPVDRIADAVGRAAVHMRRGTVVTDAGSVKSSICDAIGTEPSAGVYFVGSHPLAGSEKQGFEHSDAQLFANKTCVVTPEAGTDEVALSLVTRFWQQLGSHVVSLTPAEHDRILARTSHMPHAVAAAVAAVLTPDDAPFAATGFRDATRIAAGDPGLWTSILCANSDAVAVELEAVIDRCRAFIEALEASDAMRIEQLLAEGRRCRNAIGKSSD